MSKEAMKLENVYETIVQWDEGGGKRSRRELAQRIVALAEKPAKPDFWEGYVPEPDKRQQALDKMAENAKELGLDYEPAQQCQYPECSYPCPDLPDCRDAEQPAQQEPVATDWERIARVQDAKLRAMCNESGGFEKLCEVMDRYEHTSPQPAQRTWVGLTDEELSEVYNQADWDTVNGWEYERAIEAKLKEKNT